MEPFLRAHQMGPEPYRRVNRLSKQPRVHLSEMDNSGPFEMLNRLCRN